MLDDSSVERALVVTAHPDDVDFGAAGTVATWSDAGIEVTYCVCTDGQAGGFDPGVPRERIPAIRREEQCAAAKQVGVEDVRFLGHVDGDLQVTNELVREIVRVIRDVRPQRMLVHSPERNWERIGASHPDHLAAGEAAIRALYPFSRNPFAFPDLLADGLEPWIVSEMWVMSSEKVNHFVDVTDQFERKIAAILAHESQHPDPERVRPMVMSWLSRHASTAGFPEGRLAEAFHVQATA